MERTKGNECSCHQHRRNAPVNFPLDWRSFVPIFARDRVSSSDARAEFEISEGKIESSRVERQGEGSFHLEFGSFDSLNFVEITFGIVVVFFLRDVARIAVERRGTRCQFFLRLNSLDERFDVRSNGFAACRRDVRVAFPFVVPASMFVRVDRVCRVTFRQRR